MRRPLTEAEVKAFLDAIDVTTAQGLKDQCLFELGYAAGLGVSEVARDVLLLYLPGRAGVPQAWVFPGSRNRTRPHPCNPTALVPGSGF